MCRHWTALVNRLKEINLIRGEMNTAIPWHCFQSFVFYFNLDITESRTSQLNLIIILIIDFWKKIVLKNKKSFEMHDEKKNYYF